MAFLDEKDLIPFDMRSTKRESSWADDIRPALCYSGASSGSTCGVGLRPGNGEDEQTADQRASTAPPDRRRPDRRHGFRSADPRRRPCARMWAKINYAYILNLGGDTFPIKQSMIDSVPDSLFAKLDTSHPSYDNNEEEFFFDRGPGFFPYIRDHLEGRQLHFPHCFCPQALLSELKFWKLSLEVLPPCCCKIISAYLAEQDTIRQLEKTILKAKVTSEETGKMSLVEKWKRTIYNFLDDPDTSNFARGWVVLYTMMVLTSIAFACIVTVPSVRVPTNPDACVQYLNSSLKIFTTCATIIPDGIAWTTVVLNNIFFLEILTKFYTFPNKRIKFFLNFLNVMDIIAVILALITNGIINFEPEFWQNHIVSLSSLNAIASVLRIGRMMQFFKHNKHLRVLVLTLRYSKGDLLVLFILLLISMLIYAVAIYVAEYNEPEQFSSIPLSMWWSLITMTTVGYNDFRPITSWGYLVGAICALFGVVITGSAIPLSASSFEKLTALSRQVGAKR